MTAILDDHEGLFSRDTPKINGSSGAFVAVVVALALIIVVAGSAVVYLLLEARKESNQPHLRYQAATATSRSLEDGPTVNTASSSKIRSTVDRFLSRHKKKNSGPIEVPKSPRRSGQGWVQASGSDHEDSGDEQASAHRRQGHAAQMSEVLDISRPGSTVALSTISIQGTGPQATPPGRERVSSMLSDTSMTISRGNSIRYADPFAPTPQRSISTMTSHLSPPSIVSSPASSPPPINRLATSSPEQLSNDDISEARVYPSKVRMFATQSGNGSKFFEEL